MKLFIYGTLKRSQSRAGIVEDQKFLGLAVTAARYRLYNTGSYPALVEDGQGLEIEGELWEVDDDCLQQLDAIEGAPRLFDRREVELQPPVAGVQTYLYQQPVAGLPDCGARWE